MLWQNLVILTNPNPTEKASIFCLISTFYVPPRQIYMCNQILFHTNLALRGNPTNFNFQWHRNALRDCESLPLHEETSVCMRVHSAGTDAHACVCIPLSKCLVFYGVSLRGGKSSQLRLTGGSKWKCADVGGYYIPLKQERYLIMASSRPSFRTTAL